MFRIIAIALSCQVIGLAGAATPLSSFEIDFQKLATHKVQRYAVGTQIALGDSVRSIESEARLTLQTKVRDNDVILQDSRNLYSQDETVSIKGARAALLSLQTFVIRQGSSKVVGKYHDGKLYTKANDRTVARNFPADTVTEAFLLRVIPQLPQQVGAAFTFKSYADSRLRQSSGHSLYYVACMAIEPTRVFGEKVECARFQVSVPKPFQVYVDRQGRARKIVHGGETVLYLVLSDKDTEPSPPVAEKAADELPDAEANDVPISPAFANSAEQIWINQQTARERATSALALDACVLAIQTALPNARVVPSLDDLPLDVEGEVTIEDPGASFSSFVISKYKSAKLCAEMNLHDRDNTDVIVDGVYHIYPLATDPEQGACDKVRQAWRSFSR